MSSTVWKTHLRRAGGTIRCAFAVAYAQEHCLRVGIADGKHKGLTQPQATGVHGG